VTIVHASQLGIYTFTGSAGSETTFPVDAQPGNAVFSSMSRGAGITASAGAGTFSATAWSLGALDATDYFEFSITPDGGFSVTLTNLAFSERRSNTGIRDISIRSSLDSFAADIATINVPDDDQTRNQVVPLGAAFADQSGIVTFRFYGYTAEAAGGSWRVDNVALFGSIDSAGPPPTNVRFTASADSVSEAVGTYMVTVTKNIAEGDVSGEIVLGGTATEGISDDYTIDTTNFTMNGSTTSATFTITINDDVDPEAAETITLTLANVVGGDIVSPSVFTLTVADNDSASAVIISQYTDTESGTTPKGIEIWNVSGGDITFDSGANLLAVLIGVNGGALGTNVSVTSGTLLDGDVLVIGTSDMSPDVTQAFTFNGDDAIAIALGGVIQDVFGQPGVDPGTAWTGGGVSTADQNIQLKTGITEGDLDGWTDPSERFEFVSVGSTLTGFGTPPGGAPLTNVSFQIASASVDEGVGTYIVTVIKSIPEGDVSGEIALSGTATEGLSDDYTIDSTNFTMNGATTSATFTITINDDSDEEPAETIILTLVNVAGGTIVSPSVFTLTINANDVPPPPGAIAYYTFTGSNAAPEFVAANAGAAAITVSTGTLAFAAANSATWTGSGVPYARSQGAWTNNVTQDDAKHFVVGITADSGYLLTITNVSFLYRATAAGPPAIGFSINGDNLFSEDTAENSTDPVSEAVTGYANLAAATIRIQGWDNGSRVSTGGGDLQIDDVLIQGFLTVDGGGGFSQEQEDWIVANWGDVGSYPGDAVDSDDDGFLNVEEFVAGTDPLDDQDYFTVNSITGNTTIQVVINPSATGRVYSVRASGNLLDGGGWSVLASDQPGNGGMLSIPDAAGLDDRVYEVTVELENP